jgi:hydroxyacylglutathione hydrolase
MDSKSGFPTDSLSSLNIQRLELGAYAANAYIVSCAVKGTTLLIDAPGEAEDIIRALAGRVPTCIVLTHGHADHVECLTRLKKTLDVPVAAHPSDAALLPIVPDWLLKDGDTIALGWSALRVLHTPGHTPGSLCLVGKEVVFSGDTLFPNGPGHTRTPAEFQQIVKSIDECLFSLPDSTIAYPGHGVQTQIGKERRLFTAFSRAPAKAGMHGDVTWVAGS